MAKITSNEYVKIAWVLDASMTTTQAAAPSATILNAALDLSPAIAWQDFALGATDSDDVEDRGITDPGNAVTRGFSNFEATLSFFRDANLADTTSDYVKAWDAFKVPRTFGYLVIRVADKKWDEPFAAGDRISVFRFIADTVVDDAEGDDSVKFTVNFLPQGLLHPYTRVSGGTVTGVATTKTAAVGDVWTLAPVVGGKPASGASTFSTSDTSKVSISKNGVAKAIASGSATLTVTAPGSTPVTQAVTVS